VTSRGRCAVHGQALEQTRGLDSDRHRGRDLYQTSRWRRLRRWLLSQRPLCECDDCQRTGRVLAASVLHHVRHHGGDSVLFFDVENLMPMAKPCHDRLTALEMRKVVGGAQKLGRRNQASALRCRSNARETRIGGIDQ
jgi:5-methylcytosine-specific restriction protein A